MRSSRSRSTTPTRGGNRPAVTGATGTILRWSELTSIEQEQLTAILNNHGIQFRKIMARGGHVHNVAYLRIVCDNNDNKITRNKTRDRSIGPSRKAKVKGLDEGTSSLSVSGVISEGLDHNIKGDWQDTLSILKQTYPPVFEALGHDTGHDRRTPPAVFNSDNGGNKLQRTMEAFYTDRSVKDATVHSAKALQSIGQPQTPVANIFVNWLTGRLGLRRLTDQGMMETLLLTHRSREADMMADIFGRLLEGSYDTTDLLFFLYIRSIVASTVQVDKSPKSSVGGHHHNHHPIVVQLPLTDIKSLAKKVFGRDQKTIYDTFMHVLTDEISKAATAGGGGEKEDDDEALVEVGYFMYIALWVYHHQRPEVIGTTGGGMGHQTSAPSGAGAATAVKHCSSNEYYTDDDILKEANSGVDILGAICQNDNIQYENVVDNGNRSIKGMKTIEQSQQQKSSSSITDYLQSIQHYRRARQELEEAAAAAAGSPWGTIVTRDHTTYEAKSDEDKAAAGGGGTRHSWVDDIIHACQRSMMDSVQEARGSSRHPLRLTYSDFDAALEPCVQTVLREECTLLVTRVQPNTLDEVELPHTCGPSVADALNTVVNDLTTTADQLVQVIMDGNVDDWTTSLTLLLSKSKGDYRDIIIADVAIYERLVELRDTILADESGTLRQSAVGDFCHTLLCSSVLQRYCDELMRREILRINTS